MLDTLLSQLIQEFSLPSIQEKGKNKELALSEELSLTLNTLDVGFTVETSLGTCPPNNKEELFTHLMRANFLGQGTRGAVISMDTQEKYLTLFQLVPYDLNYRAFKHTIEDFANFATYWKEVLVSHQKG